MEKKKAQNAQTDKTTLRSYGRVKGRKLGQYHQQLMDTLLPQCSAPLDDTLETLIAGKIIYLEIGFGAGEHLVHIARTYPDWLCIGAEPFRNGVARCLADIDAYDISNIRLHTADVRELIPHLPPTSIDRCDILFPDPWPKTSHHKRRIINQHTLTMLSGVMKDNATLWLATDHADYAAWMLEHITLSPHFEWTATKPADWQTPPNDWCETRYQQKADTSVTFIQCIKKSP